MKKKEKGCSVVCSALETTAAKGRHPKIVGFCTASNVCKQVKIRSLCNILQLDILIRDLDIDVSVSLFKKSCRYDARSNTDSTT